MTANFSVPGALPDREQWLANYRGDLERLVSMDSNTHDKAGVDRVGEVLRDPYNELGAPVDVDPRTNFGDNLVIRLRGSGSGKVLLLGHTDTVYPTGTVLQRPFVREGKQAIGPGTADMKAGDLAIVYALRLLRRQNFDTFDTITVVHNSDEEIGSPGSKDLIRHHAEASDAVFVLEAGRENGDIVSGRKGIASFTLNVCGRSAHAGVNRDRGRSAALELAHLVVALENLNGRVPGATLNVGWIEAGGAVNVGFYGMWRTRDLLRVPPGWLAVIVLVLGGVTALLGIAHATVQTDLAEVVAYSSIENGGLISVGYGVALIGAAVNRPPLIAVGLLAATLQVVAHALAKSLLFSATSGIQDATGTTELEALRGVGHRLPASGTGLAIGAFTLAGLPLTAGFVSEWFLLESLMQQFRVAGLGDRLVLAVTGALAVNSSDFAAVCATTWRVAASRPTPSRPRSRVAAPTRATPNPARISPEFSTLA